jgi:2-phospho-L-lactate/phosphoenolpyruvate guanylyltransferase
MTQNRRYGPGFSARRRATDDPPISCGSAVIALFVRVCHPRLYAALPVVLLPPSQRRLCRAVEASAGVRWQILVPVRAYGVGKSRLRSGTSGRFEHADLVAALQADTLDAVAAAQRAGTTAQGNDIHGIHLVTSDAGGHLRPQVQVIVDPGGGLNAALRAGAAALEEQLGDVALLAIVADLPSLRPEDVQTVLDAAAHVQTGFVPDAEGTGTTMLAAARPSLFAPAFGPDSAERHRSQGAAELTAGAGARNDVDTARDLRRCLELGVGAHTSALLAQLQPFI